MTLRSVTAFRELKDAICTNSALHCPDFGKLFTLQKDASGLDLGGALLQELDGEMKPVVFLSSSFWTEGQHCYD